MAERERERARTSREETELWTPRGTEAGFGLKREREREREKEWFFLPSFFSTFLSSPLNKPSELSLS